MPINNFVVVISNPGANNSVEVRDYLTNLFSPYLEEEKAGLWKENGKEVSEDGVECDAVTFVVKNLALAESMLYTLTLDNDIVDTFETQSYVEEGDGPDFGPTEKSIEIYYDAKDIPNKFRKILDRRNLRKALNFRNAAMKFIETELTKAGAGEWEGAEIGGNFETGELEVNFGFSVSDFDTAESIVREAVADTHFEGIREIRRNEF